MGLISEFFFGRLTKIQDKKIGELKTKIKSDNSSINYTWTGEHKLDGQAKPTVFILEGNNLGPYGRANQSCLLHLPSHPRNSHTSALWASWLGEFVDL